MDKYTNIDKLIKAQQVFERFRVDMVDDRDQAGAVQAFEFCYELAWKVLRRILNSRGIDVASPRSAFRHAGLEKLIDNAEIWYDFQEKRNLTAHTYEEENLRAIVSVFDQFSEELEKLINNIKLASQE